MSGWDKPLAMALEQNMRGVAGLKSELAEAKAKERTALQEAVLRAAVAWYEAEHSAFPDTDECLWNALDKLLAAEPAWGDGK